VIDVLKKLSDDEKNVVYLLSGLPVEGALEKVAQALPNVGFVAEDGCYIKPKPLNGEHTEWINMVPDVSMQWKKPAREILTYFTERTPGSFIEDRGASIRWRYWPGNVDDTELPWARRQAAEAQNHIWDSLGEKFGLRLVPATRSFLILPGNASRRNCVELILKSGGLSGGDLAKRGEPSPTGNFADTGFYDFVLAVGNDERLLARLNSLASAETVSTSMKNSDAKWKLERPQVVEQLAAFIAG